MRERQYSIAILVIALGVIAPAVWQLFPHTWQLPVEEHGVTAEEIFRKPLPVSAHVTNCMVRQSPAGKDLNEIHGCLLTVAPAEFEQLLEGLQPLGRRQTSKISAALEVPRFSGAPTIAEVYYSSPPESWGINGSLVYVDSAKSRVIGYVRRYVVIH